MTLRTSPCNSGLPSITADRGTMKTGGRGDRGATLRYGGIVFPVMWVSELHVRSFVDLEHLRTCHYSELAPKRRGRGSVIDQSLTEHVVRSVRFAGGIAPFWGWRLPGVRLVRITHEFDPATKQVSVGDLQEMIIATARRGYESMAASPRRYEAQIRRKSLDELMRSYRFGPRRGFLGKIWCGPLD